MSSIKVKYVSWNLPNLAALYYKNVPNNIIIRANNVAFHKAADDEICEYLKSYRGEDDEPCHLRFGITKVFINDNNTDQVYTITRHSESRNSVVTQESIPFVIATLIPRMQNTTLRRLIINPMKPIAAAEVVNIADFTISVGDSVYRQDHPFARDIEFVSADGVVRTAHSFVIAIVSPMICSTITNTELKQNRVFNLGCSIDLIDWFIAGAYKSNFIFDEKINHEEGLELLDYFMVINRAVVMNELRVKLEIELVKQ